MNEENAKEPKRSAEISSNNANSIYEEIHLDSWDNSRDLFDKLRGGWWTFRGQKDANWHLSTSLERSAARQQYLSSFLAQSESDILKDFIRRAHQYIDSYPSEDSLLEWLALIQHYGGPTRLIDFTHSFYVAIFFAIEQAETDAAVWAINLAKLRIQIDSKTSTGVTPATISCTHNELCNSVIGNPCNNSLVLDVEPEWVSERQAAQQGQFLFPCNIEKSFEENLAESYGKDTSMFSTVSPKPYNRDMDYSTLGMGPAILKLVIKKSIHGVLLRDLKLMNITSATLFPGLNGFARSLHYHLSTFQ